MYYNKHYIRTREDRCITYWFSDAFEQPQDGDICINEQGGRHFTINGEINPPCLDVRHMIPLYYWDDEIKSRIKEDVQAEIDALPQPEPQPDLTQRVAELEAALRAAMEGLT